MIYILLIFCIAVAIIGKFTEKKIINPVTVFYAVWAIILYLTSLQLYGINDVNESTYTIMLIGFITFVIGYYLWREICKRKQYILKINNFRIGLSVNDTFELRYQILYLFCIFCVVIYLMDFSVSVRYLFSGNSLNYIRHLAQDSSSDLNAQLGIISAIKTLIISPFVMTLQAIVAYDYWLGKKDKKLLAFNIVILLLRVLTDGSRSNLIYFVLHFSIGYILVYSKKHLKQKSVFKSFREVKRSKKIIVAFIIAGIVAILWTTLSRSGEHALRYAYYYFTMEPYMFEIWSKTVDESHLIGYGLASTNGFSFALFYVLKNLRLMSTYPEFWHSINTIIGSTQTDWQIISSFASRANAYVSLFWYLYLDGRIWGVAIGMLLYGAIAANTFWTAIKNMSPRAVCMFAFILQGLLMSFVRLQFANITYAISFIMILVFYRRLYNETKEVKK